MKKKVYFLSNFLHIVGTKHGGNGRAAQLFSLLRQYDEVVDVLAFSRTMLLYDKKSLKGIVSFYRDKLLILIKGINIFLPASVKRLFNYRGIKLAGMSVDLYDRLLASGFSAEDTLLIEAQYVIYYPLIDKINKLGARVIAIPQNMDSLMPGYRNPSTGEYSLSWFQWEVAKLKKAAAVFCISREEEWFLRVWGVNAYYLPYFPIPEQEIELLSIRTERESKKGNIMLIMGSVTNIPTRLGMLQVAEFINSHKTWLNSLRIVVVGNGTEVLKEHFDKRVEILGTVSDDVMRDLWVSSKACLIHQVPTSGALTRIPELLMAGIPIIANTNAARNYYSREGIFLYEDLSEVSDGLIEALLSPPIPLPENKYYDFFQSYLYS